MADLFTSLVALQPTASPVQVPASQISGTNPPLVQGVFSSLRKKGVQTK